MKLKIFIQTLEAIAPPELAESWDNTGLLIEPLISRDIQTILLCIDLTDAVAREAIQKKADAIITYHPLFFRGLTRLVKTDPQAHVAMRLIQNNLAVYSPHTALDAAPGGVNDWLADLLGEGDIYCAETGGARIVELTTPLKLPALGKRIKQKLHLKQITTAKASDKPIKTIAVCAGSGTEALRGLQADCYFTGEMKHHDILASIEKGTSVILCGHTETERGYLAILRHRLVAEGEPELKLILSTADTSPLETI